MKVENGTLHTSVDFTASLDHDGKKLSCLYDSDGELWSHDIMIQVYRIEVEEEGPVELSPIEEGFPFSLDMRAFIYPPPADEDITWNILDKNYNILKTLKPKQTIGGYKALRTKVEMKIILCTSL